MQRKYTKNFIDNKYIFMNLEDSTKIEFSHYDNPYIFDILKITEDYDKSFVEYVIKELETSNDIVTCEVYISPEKYEEIFHKYHFKIMNYYYRIPYNSSYKNSYLQVLTEPEDRIKNYLLVKLNEQSKKNMEYLLPFKQYEEIGYNWFSNDYQYRSYIIDNKIVGVIDYKILDDTLYIRYLYSDSEVIGIQMIYELMDNYKKPVEISCMYTERRLRNIMKCLGAQFKFMTYKLQEQ